MAGNVWEWVADWYDSDHYETGLTNDPGGPVNGTSKVVRGGGWLDYSQNMRTASRVSGTPGNRFDVIGFRCVLSPG